MPLPDWREDVSASRSRIGKGVRVGTRRRWSTGGAKRLGAPRHKVVVNTVGSRQPTYGVQYAVIKGAGAKNCLKIQASRFTLHAFCDGPLRCTQHGAVERLYLQMVEITPGAVQLCAAELRCDPVVAVSTAVDAFQ